MVLKKHNLFELFFHDFVKDFGGEVLPKASKGCTADYFFREHNIVAELKTLTVDQTKDINGKLTPKVDDWIRKNGRRPTGALQGDKYIIEIKDMPPEIQSFWLKLLKASVEGFIRDANRQIRDTKHRMNLDSAKGMLIVANEANSYHDHPDSFRRIIAEVLRKHTGAGRLRFPHINGAVCFSYKDVKTRNEGMYFWANLQMKQAPSDDVSNMATFQKELQQAWYGYIEKTVGIEVRKHIRNQSNGSPTRLTSKGSQPL